MPERTQQAGQPSRGDSPAETPLQTRHRLNGAERWWRKHRERLDPYHAFVFRELLEVARTAEHADYLAVYAREMMTARAAEAVRTLAGEAADAVPSLP